MKHWKEKNKWKRRILQRKFLLPFEKFRFPQRFTDAKPFKVIYVDPSSINKKHEQKVFKDIDLPEWVSLVPKTGKFCPIRSAGLVVPGEWSQVVVDYNPKKMLLYQALEERYVNGVEWEKTQFFKTMSEMVRRGKRVWNGCTNENDILIRCARTDHLKESIEKNGILHKMPPFTVNIGPKGEFIKNGEGRHRLLICIILGINKFPVHVVVRHTKWQNTRDTIRKKRKPHNVLNHPDMQDIVPLTK